MLKYAVQTIKSRNVQHSTEYTNAKQHHKQQLWEHEKRLS